MNKKFTIRVYGILLNDKQELLVSDEQLNGFSFTKLPGGGMEWGEGVKDALSREFQEELNVQVQIGELFYLTDFFQASAFHPNTQIISVYYFVQIDDYTKIPTQTTAKFEEGKENHRWMKLNTVTPTDFTFPIDQKVLEMLKSEFAEN